MKWQLLIIGMLLVGVTAPFVTAWDQQYVFVGTYYLCHVGDAGLCAMNYIPDANTTLFVNLQAGGGGGKGTTQNAYGRWLTGLGGYKGGSTNLTASVPMGSTYALTIGGGGAQSNPIAGIGATVSYPGGDTSAFGTTVYGGAKGDTGSDASASNGGAGQNATFPPAVTSFFYAAAGQDAFPYTGGVKGYGYGAGGGGGASNWTTAVSGNATYGGNGMQGLIHLWDMNGTSGVNIPYFSATPTSVGYGNVVTFTDESIINNGESLTYEWDFGDGSTHSTTAGSVTHVYSSYGVFSPNLTITAGGVVQTSIRSNYITVTNMPITAWVPAKQVRFKVVDAYGADLPLSNVSVSYLSNSLPSKDVNYLVSAYGIPQSVANQMVTGATAMYGSTGNDGSISFMMFPAIQYSIAITNSTMGLSKYVELYPQENEYLIRCPLTGQSQTTNRITAMTNTSLYVTEPNSSYITWNLHYQDGEGYTTALTWDVTCWNNMTVMYSNSWGPQSSTDVVIDNYTFPSTPVGVEYRAAFNATRVTP